MSDQYRWVDVDFSHGKLSMNNSRASAKLKKNSSKDKRALLSHCKGISCKLKKALMERTSNRRKKQTYLNGLRSNTSLSSSKRSSKHSLLPYKTNPPKVYKFKEIYDRHREQMQRQVKKQVQQLCQFHSRPAPDFSRYHKRIESRSTVHSITVPVTPTTLLKSMAAKEKWLKLYEEQMRQQLQQPKFQFHSTAYLLKQPFMPKHTETVIKQKPFHLRCGERAKIRQKFNENIEQAAAQRMWNENIERIKYEHEQYQHYRSMTNFKAQPNPCKRSYVNLETNDE